MITTWLIGPESALIVRRATPQQPKHEKVFNSLLFILLIFFFFTKYPKKIANEGGLFYSFQDLPAE